MLLVLLFPVLLWGCGPAGDTGVRLIAHRGGVVDAQHIENSLAGLQAAIDRGYWMVEVDVRPTKDGKPLAHHDANFRKFYRHTGKAADMTWEQIRQLRSTPGNARPLLFDEFAAACRGKIRLMLDVKGPPQPEAYYHRIEKSLIENDLLKDAYIIGIPEAKRYFRGKARVSIQRSELQTAVENNEDLAGDCFLFEHADKLDADIIQLARGARVPVVVSINTFHYAPNEHKRRARADIDRLRALGVRLFQIDSVYDPWLLDAPARP